MKTTQSLPPQANQAKRQSERQLKQLFQSYCYHIGKDMSLIINAALLQKQWPQKEQLDLSGDKVQRKKLKIMYGKMIILSTLIVLICTLIGAFQYRVVLAFGVFWGFVFTKYQIKMGHQLMEMFVYWAILSIITAFQNILGLTLFFMPFYHSLKLFFIISLLYPKLDLKNRICKQYFLPRINSLSQTLSVPK